MSSVAVGHSSGSGSLSLMSCVRESSPLQDYELDNEKNVATKRRFWNPKKWFKRKNKISEDTILPVEINEVNSKDALRSRSTSELSIADEQIIRRRSGSSMHPGLSVSHDSVFHSPNSGSDIELDVGQSSSSLYISQPHVDLRLQTELSERLRLRRGRGDTSEDDEGLPHSPCNSPTTTDAFLDKTAIKDLPTKSHSTCSDGSLLSMGSSDTDEELLGQHSRDSSKLSLYEKRTTTTDLQDFDLEFGSNSSSVPLNHSAAHHKVSVRPKRTHGAPRRKRVQQLAAALPTTPEVNEELSIRSITPENISKDAISELYSMSTTISAAKTTTHTTTLTENQLKCSSLPPGLVAPGNDTNNKLNRSRSSACNSKSQEHFNTLEEDVEKEEKNHDKSFFERIFPRRSGKKKKSREEKIVVVTKQQQQQSHYNHHQQFQQQMQQEEIMVSAVNSALTVQSTYTSSKVENVYKSKRNSETKPIIAPRTGAASRQRIQPIDIPGSPDIINKHDTDNYLIKSSPISTSPLQMELENRFKQRQQILVSSSPPGYSNSPPQSPKLFLTPSMITSKIEQTQYINVNKQHEMKKEIINNRNDEIRSKMKIPGLSSLQQRVLSLNDDLVDGDDNNDNDDDENSFKSLTDLPDVKIGKPVIKSQSFKATKSHTNNNNLFESKFMFKKSIVSSDIEQNLDNKRLSMAKAASLDSIKCLDDAKTKCFHEIEREEEIKQNINKNNETMKIIDCDNTSSNNNGSSSSNNNGSSSSNNNNKENNLIDNGITISGPSHTAIVNISNDSSFNSKKVEHLSLSSLTSNSTTTTSNTTITKESVSVTKIQLKRESAIVATVPKTVIPEFFNRQLNKVELRPTSNVVLSMNTPPRIIDEQSRPKLITNNNNNEQNNKYLINNNKLISRKFSQENLEIVDKDDNEEIVEIPKTTVTVTCQPIRYKKNESNIKNVQKKSSTTTPDLPKKLRSVSLDSLKSDESISIDNNKSSSQDSLDKLDDKIIENEAKIIKDKTNSITEQVILRKKSLINQNKNDEEPELMKVFARRSLKLKDNESEIISKQVTTMVNENEIKSKDSSDKENQIDSPIEERKKSLIKSKEPLIEISDQRSSSKSMNLIKKESNLEMSTNNNNKEMIIEIIKNPIKDNQLKQLNETKCSETTEVTLRKQSAVVTNNNFNVYQRTVSLNSTKTINDELKLKKQSSFNERRKTDNWINTNLKNSCTNNELNDSKISSDSEIITNISPKSEFINEEFLNKTKNFNQRKAEWEKRAQEAQKKSVP